MRKTVFAIMLLVCAHNAVAVDIAAKIFADAKFQEYIRKYYKSRIFSEDGSLRERNGETAFSILDQSTGMYAIAAGIGKHHDEDIESGIKSIKFGLDAIFPSNRLINASVAHASRFLFNIAISY